jgi:hypothetical protein
MRALREIEILFLKERVTAVLLDAEAPKVSEILWQSLPFETFPTHAKIAGPEIMAQAPFFIENGENEVQAQEAGNIAFWPSRQILCLFYGSCPGLGPISLVARVTENIEGLKAAGRRIWVTPGERITFRRKS